jgi:hypothetical protein
VLTIDTTCVFHNVVACLMLILSVEVYVETGPARREVILRLAAPEPAQTSLQMLPISLVSSKRAFVLP